MGRLDGRVAVITGAASGIGAAAARLFAAEGAAVAVLDRDADGAGRVAESLEGKGLALAADITDPRAVEEALARAAATFGRVDVLYNNAGVVAGFGPTAELTAADLNLCLSVNVAGTVFCTQAALPHLRAAGGGSIVIQSSVAALVGLPGLAAYCTAKAALLGLTRSLAAELSPEGIRVNAICAGTVDTPMARPLLALRGEGDAARGAAVTAERYPIGRIGAPEDIARAALFLASDESAFVTGSVVTADGGMTMV
jgi:NAD(P)-dependent dehydrogenase (short-subunit alcohol dehydrogenase family)